MGAASGLPVADDLGSGALVDLPTSSATNPRSARRCAPASTWCASAATSCWAGPRPASCWAAPRPSRPLKRHPLARAVRVDKMTLAALEGTLLLYRDPEAAREPPSPPCATWSGRRPRPRLWPRAVLRAAAGGAATTRAWRRSWRWSHAAKAGGGSLPLLEIPSHAVTVRLPGAVGRSGGPGSRSSGRAAAGGRAAWPRTPCYLDVLALAECEMPLLVEAVAVGAQPGGLAWGLETRCSWRRPSLGPGQGHA